MPSITSLANKLQTDFPAFAFTASDEFHWSPIEKAIFYDAKSADTPALLHELAHALLGHETYTRDLYLIGFERDAWKYATKELAPTYKVAINEEEVEDALDTYRDWLHARSICPGCHATGIQTKKNEYKCIICRTKWRVNDARACALRRYKITK